MIDLLRLMFGNQGFQTGRITQLHASNFNLTADSSPDPARAATERVFVFLSHPVYIIQMHSRNDFQG